MRFLTWLFSIQTDHVQTVVDTDQDRVASVPPPVATVAPRMPVSRPQKATRGNAHFASCLSRYPHLAPRDASVKAFVVWMQEQGEHGEHEQCWLQEYYLCACQMTGVEKMPGKWFGKALLANGCRRRQKETVRGGERYRPYVVEIPPLGQSFANDDSNVVPIGNRKRQKPPIVAASARSGTSAHRRKRFAPAPQAGAHKAAGKGVCRAGIHEAAAC